MDKNETVKRSYQDKPDPRSEQAILDAAKIRVASMNSVFSWEAVTEVDHEDNARRMAALRRRLREFEEGADQA